MKKNNNKDRRSGPGSEDSATEASAPAFGENKSDDAVPRSAKKNVAKKKSAEATVSVQALYMEAGRYIEAAAMIRGAARDIVERFRSDGGQLPPLLLKRAGSGPRAATMEAILAADNALAEVAHQFELRAGELLGLPLAVGANGPTPSCEDLIVDEVVPREHAEAELRMVGKKTRQGLIDWSEIENRPKET